MQGYTSVDKRKICENHLIPKQIRVNGLEPEHIKFTEDVVAKIIESYTREAGVRNLEREVGSVCRAKAVEYADAKDAGHLEKYKSQLTVEDVENILGIEKFEEEIAEKTSRPVSPSASSSLPEDVLTNMKRVWSLASSRIPQEATAAYFLSKFRTFLAVAQCSW